MDAILTDLPYGTTACSWDTVIPFVPMWAVVKRVLKPRGVFVTTAGQPFTSALVMSNLKWFQYCWVWDKVNMFTNQMNADKQPMRQHEDIAVFSVNGHTYNAQMQQGKPYKVKRSGRIDVFAISPRDGENATGMMHPGTVIQIPARNPKEQGLHPTQKPVALYAYLVRTYTNEGDTVLDFCFGSCTTGVACIQTGRRFIGVEIDEGYFKIGVDRMRNAQMQLPLALSSCDTIDTVKPDYQESLLDLPSQSVEKV